LMRQLLVAQFLRMQPGAPPVDVVALGFVGNSALASVPDHLIPLKPRQVASIVETWNAVLAAGGAQLRHVTAEEVVAAIDAVPSLEVAPGWREYLRSRYGL